MDPINIRIEMSGPSTGQNVVNVLRVLAALPSMAAGAIIAAVAIDAWVEHTVHPRGPAIAPASHALIEVAEHPSKVAIDATHSSARQALEAALDDPPRGTIIVRGPRNAGKSWATRSLLEKFRAKDEAATTVTWIKCNALAAPDELVYRLEQALTVNWEREESVYAMARQILAHASNPSTAPTAVANSTEARLYAIFHAMERFAAKAASNNHKWVVLLDGFERASLRTDGKKDPELTRLMRVVIERLSNLAKDGVAQPIVVSSESHVDEFFDRRALELSMAVYIDHVEPDEANAYVHQFVANTLGIQLTDVQVDRVVDEVGLLIDHVKRACERIVTMHRRQQIAFIADPDAVDGGSVMRKEDVLAPKVSDTVLYSAVATEVIVLRKKEMTRANHVYKRLEPCDQKKFSAAANKWLGTANPAVTTFSADEICSWGATEAEGLELLLRGGLVFVTENGDYMLVSTHTVAGLEKIKKLSPSSWW